MRTRHHLLLVPLVAVALALAGCALGGSSHPPTVPQRVSGHPCAPGDYYMQCAVHTGLLAAPLRTTQQAVAYGVDFAWSCPLPAGASFGASYLSYDHAKNWTRACVDRYHHAGRATVAVWETSANRATAGYAAGQSDARAARAQAAALGEPSNRPIYFAVDYDTTAAPGRILAYFRGADSVLGRDRVGAGYGGLATIRSLFANRLVKYGWQTAAWSHGVWDPHAQLQQYRFTGSLDWNRAVARDYGQWPYQPPAPPVTAHANALCREYAHYRREVRAHTFPEFRRPRARAVRNALASHNYGCHLRSGKAYRR